MLYNVISNVQNTYLHSVFLHHHFTAVEILAAVGLYYPLLSGGSDSAECSVQWDVRKCLSNHSLCDPKHLLVVLVCHAGGKVFEMFTELLTEKE